MHIRTVFFALLLLAALPGCGSMGSPDPTAEAPAPIVGGIPDKFRSYVVGVGDDFGAFCTGTVISRRSVLTAGHCYGGITRVFFGPILTVNPTSVAVVKEVRHPGYNTISLANDLTMLELAADPPTQPAPMLRETMDASFVGPIFSFVGYGDNGQNQYDVRRVATFPIAAVGPASVGVFDGGSGPIDATMFYYAVPLKNTCSGDSGGPAFVARGRVERMAGSTSFGDDNCVIDGVDARTDVPQIASFIQPMIDQFEGMDPCRANGACDESCNVSKKLVDPDCADKHCSADGMCVISCVNPVDPDCAGVDHCAADGACDPGCPSPDPDCAALSDAGAPGSGASSAGAGGSNGMSGGGGMGPMDQDAGTGGESEKKGCGCRSVGSEKDADEMRWVALLLGALALGRRRRIGA